MAGDKVTSDKNIGPEYKIFSIPRSFSPAQRLKENSYPFLRSAYGHQLVNRISNKKWHEIYEIQLRLSLRSNEITVEDEKTANSDFGIFFNKSELIVGFTRQKSLSVGNLDDLNNLLERATARSDDYFDMLTTMNLERYRSMVQFCVNAGLNIPDPSPEGTILLGGVERNLDHYEPPIYGTKMDDVVRRDPSGLSFIRTGLARARAEEYGIRPALVLNIDLDHLQ